MMDLVHVWYDDRRWSKTLCSTIPIPIHDFKVKVTDLEFLYWSSEVLSFWKKNSDTARDDRFSASATVCARARMRHMA